MAEEKKSITKRKKPRFLRRDWHKKIKLGSTVKKNRKWRGAKGRHNKLRLNRKGYPRRPKIGWSLGSREEIVRVMNVDGLANVDKGSGIVIGAVGLRKRKEIIAKANELKIKVLNKYKVAEVKK